MHRAGEVGEQWAQPLDLGRAARGVDHEILHLGLDAGAAHRAIKQNMTGLAQRRLGGGLVFELERRSLDHDAARHIGFNDGGDRRSERGRLR